MMPTVRAIARQVVVFYLRNTPLSRGRGWLIRNLLFRVVPDSQGRFVSTLPGGLLIEFEYRETLGYVTLIEGGFEAVELETARSFARPGTTAIDVGANVGIYSLVMAAAVGSEGCVFSIEPDPANAVRLKANLALNAIHNTTVVQAAAAETEGPITLQLSDDPAYHSLFAPKQARRIVGAEAVSGLRIDRIWKEAGTPTVSIMKVDVEGAELTVLKGSRELLKINHPTLLLEAASKEELEALHGLLTPLGYRRRQVIGFAPWNHLFVWGES
jgi:FkbM family methyltransferase